jgi:hypothetical protein
MKQLFGDAELEEVRSYASPVQNIMSCNRSADFGVKKYVFFEYPDEQSLVRISDTAQNPNYPKSKLRNSIKS